MLMPGQKNCSLHFGVSYWGTRRAAMRQMNAAEEKTQPAGSRSVTTSRLRGYWLVIVRLLCLCIYVVSIVLVIVSIPSYFASLHFLCSDVATMCNATGQLTASDLQRLQALGLSMEFFA